MTTAIGRRLAAVPGARRTYAALRSASAWLRFVHDFRRFRGLSAGSAPRFPLRWRDRGAILDERTVATAFDRHYVYHPAWAARILRRTAPEVHIDISSTLHFCATVSAFVPVRFYDFRPADLALSGLACDRADLTALPFESGSVASLSSMHVVEHVGLGRYGEPLDPEGDLKAIHELARVLAPGGDLLFVVPVGQPRICYNAHRIYSYRQITEAFCELELHQHALVPDRAEDGGLLTGAPEQLFDRQRYGCGCFWFRSRS